MAKKLARNEWAGVQVVGISGWCSVDDHINCVGEASTFICNCGCHAMEGSDE